jgi:hypothetical protein
VSVMAAVLLSHKNFELFIVDQRSNYAYGGSRSRAPVIVSLGTRWRHCQLHVTTALPPEIHSQDKCTIVSILYEVLPIETSVA